MQIIRVSIVFLSFTFSIFSWADDHSQIEPIQVVINAQTGLTSLSRKQVMSLFLGRSRNFPNAQTAKAFDHKVDSDIRKRFFETLTGKTISDIDAYWARLRYSGRASPPKELEDVEAVLKEVMSNKHSIAYVTGQDTEALAKQGIVVVYTLGNH